jgi:hypothetical protein
MHWSASNPHGREEPYSKEVLIALVGTLLATRDLALTDLPGSVRDDSMMVRQFIVEAGALTRRASALGDAITEVRRAHAAERRLALRFDTTAAVIAAAERGKEWRSLAADLRRLERKMERDGDYHLQLVTVFNRRIELLDDAARTIGALPLSGFCKVAPFFRHSDTRRLDHLSARLVAAADFEMLDRIADAARAGILPRFVAGLRTLMGRARLRKQFDEFARMGAETSRWINRWELIGAAPWLETLPLPDWLGALGKAGIVRIAQSGPGTAWFVRGCNLEEDAPVPTTREGKLEGERQQRLLRDFFSQ